MKGKIITFFLLTVIILFLLEYISGLIDHDLKGQKKWLETKHDDILLICYPTNFRNELPINLNDPSHYSKYFKHNDINRSSPYCVENIFNNFGYRESFYYSHKKSEYRIAFIGDSFLMGEGVKKSKRLTDILSATFKTREILNIGLLGRDLPQIFDINFHEAIYLDSDLIIYCLVLNDFYPLHDASTDVNLYYRTFINTYQEDLHPIYRYSNLLRSFYLRWKNKKLNETAIQWYRNQFMGEGNGWEKGQVYIKKMYEICSSQDRQFAVVIFPLFYNLSEKRYPFKDIHIKIGTYLDKIGINYLDLFDKAYKNKKASDLTVHPLDAHPNGLAHKLAAEEIEKFIVEKIF